MPWNAAAPCYTLTMKRTWFEVGAANVERLWPEAGRAYRCPLCGRFFSSDGIGDLTEEHAPPESLGGKAVALTCRPCNSRAGGTVDAAMGSQAELRRIAARVMDKPIRARLRQSGHDVNVDVKFTPEGVQVFGLPERNDPAEYAGWIADMNKMTEDGSWGKVGEMRLTRRFKDPGRLGLVGWMRSAYVLAFAALGYTYAFNVRLKEVWRQLGDPSAEIVDACFYRDLRHAPPANRLLMVEKPAEVQSILVQMGRHAVFLPGISHGSPEYAELLAQVRAASDGRQRRPVAHPTAASTGSHIGTRRGQRQLLE